MKFIEAMTAFLKGEEIECKRERWEEWRDFRTSIYQTTTISAAMEFYQFRLKPKNKSDHSVAINITLYPDRIISTEEKHDIEKKMIGVAWDCIKKSEYV